MPSFTYTGDDDPVSGHHFPSHDGENPSFEVVPGDTVEVDSLPDDWLRFFEPAAASGAAEPEPVPAPAAEASTEPEE